MNGVVFGKAGEISEEIESRLKGVLVLNGYETDIGSRVMMGRTAVEDSMLPCAVVIEGMDTVRDATDGATVARVFVEQEYIVMGYVPCDPDQPNTAAHAVIRDLKRAIFRTNGEEDSTFGGSVRRVKYQGRDIGVRADGAASVAAAIIFSVQFVEALANP